MAAIHNHILEYPPGPLVIPGAVAGPVLQALISGTQELDKKLREQQQMPPAAGNA